MLLACLFVATDASAQKRKLHTIGDSTQENRATDGSDYKRGWTQMLQQFIDDSQFVINNRGKSGASSKSYYNEAPYWKTLVTGGSDQMSNGDFLIIQFAHNDEKTGGSDGDELIAYYTQKGDATAAAGVDYRGTTASNTYKQYLRKYVNEAKAMGVHPILVGAICRSYFSGGKITNAGQHNLCDKFNIIKDGEYIENTKLAVDDHSQDYTYQMKLVAEEYDDVPFINLTAGTKDLYEALKEEYVSTTVMKLKELGGDGTHPSLIGATLIARKFAQMVKDQAEEETNAKKKAILQQLAAAVQISNEMTFSTEALELGEGYVGTTIKGATGLSAFGLDPSTGNLEITASDGFEISIDGQTYSSSIQAPYSGGTFIGTVYARANIGSAGQVNGTITVSDGTNQATCTLTYNGKPVATGTETTIVWPLTADAKASETTLTADDETLSKMTVKNYAIVGEKTMQRLMPEGTAWPGGEIDEVSDRYIQFKVTIPEDKTFYLDKISFNVAGVSAGDVAMRAYCSTNSAFPQDNKTIIGEKTRMTSNTPMEISKDIVKTIEGGESLYIRIYPWKEEAVASGKYIALSDLTVHGIVANKTSEAATFGIGRTLDGTTFADGLETTMGTAPTGITFEQCSTAWKNTTTTAQLKHGSATPVYTGGTAIRNLGTTNTAVQNAFQDDFYWGFKVTIPEGFFMSVSQIYTDVYGVKNTLTSKIQVRQSLNGANLYESENYAANVENGKCERTIETTNVTALQQLTGDVFFLMPWYSGSSATYYALKDFNITATLTKDIPSTKYTLTTNVSPEGAGSIISNPEGSSFKEGTTVQMTPKKNFGYKFKEWQLDGATASTEETFNVTMDADKTVTAVFESVPTYTVDVLVKNDLDMPGMGAVTLTPNDHNGKYEEGEEVTVKAQTSKILKFMNWEDNSTTNPRSITVDKDMTVTANYEIQDFIAVFNASKVQGYAANSSYPFNADLTWDENRKAAATVVKQSDGSLVIGTGSTPVVRNRTKVVIDGVDGLYQNGYDTKDIAFQYQFSTVGFTSAKFIGDIIAKNGARTNYKAMYSTDGTTFSDITGADWTLTASTAKNIEFSLPADAAGKEMVYIRICGYGDSQFNDKYDFTTGTSAEGLKYTNGSESGVGNVFVLGEAVTATDEIAPKLTSTIPVAGATGIPASGNIVISFDEKIQLSNRVNGIATLNGETLTPVASAKSVSFQYVNLEYGKTYTFSMPAGYVEDKSGNAADAVELTFTIMERQKPAARIFDAVVDKTLDLKYGESIEATETMPKQYRYIQDAINDAPEASTKPYLIYIKEGYYDDGNPYFNDSYGQRYDLTKPSGSTYEVINNSVNGNGTDKSDPSKKYDDCKLIYINKPNVHLIGQAVDKVTIATDRMAGGDASRPEKVWYHVNAGAAVEIQKGGNDALLSTLTIDNENWTKDRKEGPQALCLNTDADRLVFNELNIQSYQDDYKCAGTYNRAFWFKSRFEGSVDYIYGDCDVWFEECIQDINRKTGGYIVAPSHPKETRWGYVFNNNVIKSTMFGADCQVWLGRPWHWHPKTVFLNTRMETKPYDQYWAEEMGGLPAVWAVKNITDKNGIAMSEESRLTYKAKKGADNFEAEGQGVGYTSMDATYYYREAKNTLTDEDLVEYTIQNVLAGDKSTEATGYWNPLTQVEKTATPEVTVNGNIAQWTADEYAICYVVTVNGKPSAFVTDAQYVGTEDEVITVQSVNENGILSAMSNEVTLSTATSVIAVENANGSANATDGIYTIDGKKTNSTDKGIIIMNGVKRAVK